METKPIMSQEMEIGAKVIGQVVIEATKVCNQISESAADNSKELVNLVMGRCEVFKAEILAIVGCEVNLEQKTAMMETEREAACDYFNSILAQIC